MADNFSEEERSNIMRQVKSSRNKSTEQRLIEIFKEANITGWRRNYKLFGKPDFVFSKSRLAIFTDGCFWHGHSCKVIPQNNRDYWLAKIKRNKQRDKDVTKTLKSKNWLVLRIWECDLKKYPDKIKKKLFEKLQY